MNKNILTIGITILFLGVVVTPMTLGYNDRVSESKMLTEDYQFNRYLYPEYYDCYNTDEIDDYVEYQDIDVSIDYEPVESTNPLDSPPMESPWPMYCHDVRHTSRSPYNTADNPGSEKWRFDTTDDASGSPVIDEQGIIYIGSSSLNAVYPNGTLKWKYETIYYNLMQAPAIDENGVIYFGTAYGNHYLFAIYTSNGTLKWKFWVGDSIFSSPAIGDDGAIFFGSSNHHIYALNPNGTLKWKFKTGDNVLSSPAIGLDGTVYCGSHDDHVYALYSNNGSLKWKFKTGAWVHGSPTISNDGIIYIGSDDGYLYALYHNNGSMKWRCNVGSAVWGSPALDEDGNLYVGVWDGIFHAIYPNGTIKWSFDTDGQIWWTSASLSDDGIIYFGSNIDIEDMEGGELIALNPDGTERWRILIAYDWTMSAPAIGEDGSVYIGSCNDGYHPGSWGYLHAIGELDPNAPSTPEIDGPKNIKPDVEYEYKFNTTSPLGNDVFYWVEWGDNKGTGWIGPYSSGEQITVSHKWPLEGTTTIKARVKDTDNLWGPWGKFEIEVTTSAPTKPTIKGPTRGKIGVLYDYKFMSTHPDGDEIWYYIDWGDHTNTDWFGPHSSGTEVMKNHKWIIGKTFVILAKAKDIYDAESEWSEFKIEIPRTRATTYLWYQCFLERFPILQKLINFFI